MNGDQNAPAARLALALHIGQRVRHQDYQGRRVTGIVQGLWVDIGRGLMVDCVLDAPIVIPPGDGYDEVRIQRQYAPANEFAPFDDRDELLTELLKAAQAIRPHLPDVWSLDGAGMQPAVQALDAAIAKATGPITS